MVVSSETPLIDVGVLAVPAGLLLQARLDRGVEHFLFLVRGGVEERGVALLGAQAEMDEQRRVAAVVEDHVRGSRRRAHSKMRWV